MFKSKTRSLIFPQSEHSRLAGTVAMLWGNANFDRPAFDFDSFVAGVALHDHGHGYFDTHAIGEMDLAEQLDSLRGLAEHRLADPIADAVANFHVLRLLQGAGIAPHLLDQVEQQIAEGIARTGIPRDVYLWADKITRLCDNIAFDFCFDEPAGDEIELHPRQNQPATIPISYRVAAGHITLDPWPLSVDAHAGFILAYEAETYPNALKPVLAHYRISKG